MAQFADYGFNRSHSMAYAVLAFQTAYLKAHYPGIFLRGRSFARSAGQRQGLQIFDRAQVDGTAASCRRTSTKATKDLRRSTRRVRYGLTAIKGIGTSSVSSIVEARKAGKFTSLFDFVSRVEAGAVNRRGLESLITAGAFDSLMPEETATASGERGFTAESPTYCSLGSEAGTTDLEVKADCLVTAASEETMDLGSLPQCSPWSQAEISKHEKAAVGFYLSVHPLDHYRECLDKLGITAIADYNELVSGQGIYLAGLVSSLQVRYSKKGNRFGTFRLEDQSGGIKCVAWGETFGRTSSLLRDDELVIAEGRIEASDGQEVTLIINEIKLLADAEPLRARRAAIRFPNDVSDVRFYERVFRLLNENKGECGVSLKISADDVETLIETPHIRVKGSANLEQELQKLGCSVDWVI